MVQSVRAAFDKLTPREREILRLIAAHLQSKEIARALGLSPKTVEMHVLSARRRLAGMSRRDAALAFVAWEEGAPGNDYRKRPDGLAALPTSPLPGDETGSEHERTPPEPDPQPLRRPDLAGQNRRTGSAGASPAQGPGHWRAALWRLVAGAGDDGLPDRRPPGQRWRHELTSFQWLGLVLGVTAVIAVSLAAIAIGVDAFIMAIQRITHY